MVIVLAYAFFMICPYCASDTKVTNSRSSTKYVTVWRRRQCKSCFNVWTTRESVDLSSSHRVSRNNEIEPFYRDKLFLSIKDSLQHRKSNLEDATALTDTVLGLVLSLNNALIRSHELALMVSDTLNRFDPIASDVYRAKHSI